MLAHSRLMVRSLVAVGLLAVATAESRAQVQPKVDTRPIPLNPNFPWQKQPDPQQKGQPKSPVLLMPSINTMPGIPASSLFPPAFPSLVNPALDNPWMNQVTVNPYRVNPFAMNPLFNNPFMVNPLLRNPAFDNPLNMPGFFPPSYSPTSIAPSASYTPPIAIRQPGMLMYRGPDLQVNPTTGTVYHPLSGTVTLADGTTFYRVPGSGQPTASGTYATGTGLYYNPQGNTFFNPSSGVISKPGQTNVFLPYVW
jgi:hypothetical protein